MFLDVFKEDGYAALTPAGYIACAVVILLIVVLSILFVKPKENAKPHWKSKQLVFSAACLALAFLLSYIQPYKMPWGGSVTLCSMLFVTLIGYWYGPKIGITAGFAYGLLQFVQDGGSYILSPLQACLDYIVAFAALGLSGLFYKKANGLLQGYLFAIFARGVFHTIGGYLYWMDYMPENFPSSLAAIYPIAYNYAYILAEGLITIVILSLPPVKGAMARVKKMAV